MRIDFNKLLSDKNSLVRLVVLILLAILYASPGLLLIGYSRPNLIVDLSFLKLFFLSAALSLPFQVLAALILSAPSSTQIEILRDPSKLRAYAISIATLIWAVLLLIMLPVFAAFMRLIFPPFGGVDLEYQLLYSYLMFLVYSLTVLGVSSLRVLKALKKDS